MTSRVLLVAMCGVLLPACKVPPAICPSGAELHEDVDQRAAAAAFLPLVPGVYGGAAKHTPLGDLALLTMDLRAVSGNNFDGTVFGRADVDADNTLRFQFALEDHGAPTFIFRNGGKFWGVDRDTRTELVAASEDGRCLRFCSLEHGCEYLNAIWERPSAERVSLTAQVRERPHLLWEAERLEDRRVPDALSAPPLRAADQPMPVLGTLDVRVDLGATLTGGDVWLVLSTSACGQAFDCHALRAQYAVALGGVDGSFAFELNQLHAGDYFVSAFLDRDLDYAFISRPDDDEPRTEDVPVHLDERGSASVTLAF